MSAGRGDQQVHDRQVIPQAELRERLAGKTVAILGCGGLGSNCAVMLVRAGVLNLTLADYDVVEAENLNRQAFFADQVGTAKIEALAHTLRRIDDRVVLRLVRDCIDEANVVEIIQGADAVIEAVDGADTKAMIVGVCTRDVPHIPLVSASGIAGHDSANRIQTMSVAQNLWVVGDLESDIRDGHALVSSRVATAAAHQAHAVIRLLLGFPA